MKEFILNLDKPRRLKFDFRAIRAIKQKYKDFNIEDILDVGLELLPDLVWAGLIWEDKDLTPERVEEMLNERIGSELTIASIAVVMAEAAAACIGGEPGKKATSSTDSPGDSESPPEN